MTRSQDEMLEPFFHSVIRNLATSPNGATFVAKLGIDPAIKLAWSSLNFSKSKKMANILDSRPDLFSRFMTEKAQPMVRLEPLGYDCLPPNPIPPLDKAAAAAARARAAPAGESTEATTPTNTELALSPAEARKAYLRVVMSTLANREECQIELPALGSIPEVQVAWKAGGFDKKSRMTEVLKTRPDLVSFSVDDQGHVLIALTERGVQSVLDDEVPEPDRNICPVPAQPRITRNVGSHSNYRRDTRGRSRSRSRSRDRRDDRDRRDGRDRRDARSRSMDRRDVRYSRDLYESRLDVYGRPLPHDGHGRYDGHYAAGFYGAPPGYGGMNNYGGPPGYGSPPAGSPPGGYGGHGYPSHHAPVAAPVHYPPPAQPPVRMSAQPPSRPPAQPPPSSAVVQYSPSSAPSFSSQYAPAQPPPQYSPGQYSQPNNYPAPGHYAPSQQLHSSTPTGHYAPSQFQPSQPYYRDRP